MEEKLMPRESESLLEILIDEDLRENEV